MLIKRDDLIKSDDFENEFNLLDEQFRIQMEKQNGIKEK